MENLPSYNHYSPEESQLFSELEMVTSDPVTERHLEEAKEAEAIIDKHNYPQILTELNRSWPHVRTPVTVTGQLWSTDSLGEMPEVDFHEDQTMLSWGFSVLPHSLFTGEELDGDTQVRLCHTFIAQDDETGQTTYRFAELDKVAIEYSVVSDEAIENRLRHFHGDIMDDIDYRILNCNDEIEALEQLADFELDMVGGEKGNIDDLPEYIVRYINRTLEFDAELPYKLSMHDSVFLSAGDFAAVPMSLDQPKTELAMIKGVALMPKIDQDGDWDFTNRTLAADISVMSSDKHKPATSYLVSLSNLSQVESIRLQG